MSDVLNAFLVGYSIAMTIGTVLAAVLLWPAVIREWRKGKRNQ